jgi:hypothetical protein
MGCDADASKHARVFRRGVLGATSPKGRFLKSVKRKSMKGTKDMKESNFS